jgi:hypothetical protein
MILLATLLVQSFVSMHALDDAMPRDSGKARIFMGHDTWVSGHPDKIATFAKDMKEMETKKNMSLIPGIDRDLFEVAVGTFTGLLVCYFFPDDIKKTIVWALTVGPALFIRKYINEYRYQQAVAQRVKDLGLEVYTEKDADKIK